MGHSQHYGLLALMLVPAVAPPAKALPSFAEQTGQPCAACHVGAFGPQLTQAGREFKLNGYVLSDGGDHFPPVTAMAQTSFTHTQAGQAGGAAPGFGANDNLALDQASLFYAGRVTDKAGAFIQTTYNGVGNGFTWDNLDLRYANSATLAGTDFVYGVTLNNNPTVQDLWNTTPAWGFPFGQSRLAPTPVARTLIDGGLAQQVVGAGAYILWNDLLYVELDAYRGLSPDAQKSLGLISATPPSTLQGFSPYWRIAFQHSFGPHYAEIGTFGIDSHVFPGDSHAFGADHITDVGIDATYQFTPSPKYNVSAYATYIRESQALHASQFLAGSLSSDTLRTLRANVSFTFDNTFTVNAQRFQTFGSADAALYGTANGSINSAGWIGELDYTPTGKRDSPFPSWLNVKFSLQYVAYTAFNGATSHASDHNTFYPMIWFAFPLN